MAITLTGAGWYSKTSFFSAAGNAFTYMGWAFANTLPVGGPSNYTVLGGMLGGASSGIACGMQNVGGVNRWQIGTQLNDFNGSSVPVISTWYHFALVRNGTGKTLYINGVSEVTGTDAAVGHTTLAVGDYDISDNTDEWLGRIAAIKLWDGAALTQAEVQQEMWQMLPVRTANLRGFYPLLSLSDDEIDFSGNAQTLTVGGSGHAVADTPPVAWKSARLRRMYLAATGTVFTQALTAALTFTGAQAKLDKKAHSASLTFIGTQAKFTTRGLTASLSFIGSTLKRTSRAVTGAVSFIGTWSQVRLILMAFTAAVSFIGAISKQTTKSLNGSLTFTGTITRAMTRALTAAVTFSGSIAKRTSRAITAALSFVGTLVTSLIAGGGILYTKALTASLTFVGFVGKGTRRGFTASLGTLGGGIGVAPAIILIGTRLAVRIKGLLYELLN